jgi:hypothetical protein
MNLKDVFDVEKKIEVYKNKLKNMESELQEKLLENLKYPVDVDRVNLGDREICFVVTVISLSETSLVYYSLKDKKLSFRDDKIHVKYIKMILSAIDKVIEEDIE